MRLRRNLGENIMWFGSSRTLILRGLITVAFGALLIGWPAISLTVLILLFGAFALVDGALILAIGLEMPSGEVARPVAFIAGALAVIVGIATFLWPGLTELVLLALIALRAIVVGIAEIVIATRIGRHASAAWLLACVGVLSIAFGTLLLVYPGTGILALVWVIGLYAIVIGSFGIARAWLLTTTRYA
jgi:uncharacterized membrane protein HdeD (DUF308 family)